MGGYKHSQLKGRSYEEIQKLFDKAYKHVSSFVPMDLEEVKISVTRTKGSSKRAGDELEFDKSKKQKIDEHDIDREDLETLWKLVKAKHENTRPEEDYERVLMGDFELFDNCVSDNLRGLEIYILDMLVKKSYPLTPITSQNMMNKKLQVFFDMRCAISELAHKQSWKSVNEVFE
ncbi:hypothetical protein Tco_1388145 [Tanacetum coccineum]